MNFSLKQGSPSLFFMRAISDPENYPRAIRSIWETENYEKRPSTPQNSFKLFMISKNASEIGFSLEKS